MACSLAAVATQTWLPHTIGLECARPGTGTRHLTPLPAGTSHVVGAAGPHFALERWTLPNAHYEAGRMDRCLTVTNVGDPVTIRYQGGTETLKFETFPVRAPV